MSTSSYLTINPAPGDHISVEKLITALINTGWLVEHGGECNYLPLGDEDNYNWEKSSISIIHLIDIFKKKEMVNENIGVSITWKDTNVGGELLIFPDKTLSFSLSTNRRCVIDDYTDVNWYLEKFIATFRNGEFAIESWEFSEHM